MIGFGSSGAEAEDPVEEFAEQLRRTVDRLREIPIGRLTPLVGTVRESAQWFANQAVRLEAGVPQLMNGDGSDTAVAGARRLPDLPVAAVGDALAITGFDLLSAVRELRGNSTQPLGAAEVSVCRQGAARLRDLRQSL